jgi:hypothetical protein
MREPKTKVNNASVNAFLNRAAGDRRRADCLAIADLMRKATGKLPKMWGSAIVGFGSYTYRYADGRECDWPMIAFSPRKQNLVLYLMCGSERSGALMKKLGKYKTGKSCLYIKKLADIDVTVLKALIKESIALTRQTHQA